MGLPTNALYRTDCLQGLKQVEPQSVHLAFADPPFNIGYDYDVYDDRRAADDYLGWCREWMTEVHRVLRSDGTFWLAIGDEYAAELKMVAQRDVGFHCRSWVIWYYTFGVNCARCFSRSHTHLFYFVKDPLQFTFNLHNPTVRVPSARQLVYADSRANPIGRLPDNTWILRPQDLPEGFRQGEDTWYFPRVAGTFKEREGFHGCQMPEQLLGRIIRSCSHPTDVVLDPFSGSGTTLVTAKKLGRQWLGFELSEQYAERIEIRLAKCHVGDPLDGAENPLASAPPTQANHQTGAPPQKKKPRKRKTTESSADRTTDIVAAYNSMAAGASVDQILADPELNRQFAAACKELGLAGTVLQWNRDLVRLRKRGELPQSGLRRQQIAFADMDPFWFASEISMQLLGVDCDISVDQMLCDPRHAESFDQLAESYAPGFSALQYRWAALGIRKKAKTWQRLSLANYAAWLDKDLPAAIPISEAAEATAGIAGGYLLLKSNGVPLYAGATQDLGQRLQGVRSAAAWQKFEPVSVAIVASDDVPFGWPSVIADRYKTLLNSRLIIPSAKSRVAKL